ncbi:ribonuclease H-like domain-containing protein [Tanacetum coccineum]
MVTRSQVGTVKPNPRFHGHTSPISLIPKSPSVALSDPNWQDAMYDEYNALIKNSTWVLVSKPPNVNVVRSMWLFRHKYHADGSLSRYKARLVANGHSQQFSVDCDDTFSPVVKLATIRTEFDMTNLGALNYFLEIFVARDSTGMFLSQKKYALELLDRAHMANCNPTRTSVDTESKLGSDGDPISDPTLYRSLAGGLQHLTFTHPDISYAVQQVYLHMHDPREPHLAALKRVLRYVHGTLAFGLQLYASITGSLVAYTDADWASCLTTRRSTSGYCVFLGDNLLLWSAKRQHTLSRSSAEAEYRGVANVVAETAWLRNLFRELHTPLLSVTLVYYDIIGVICGLWSIGIESVEGKKAQNQQDSNNHFPLARPNHELAVPTEISTRLLDMFRWNIIFGFDYVSVDIVSVDIVSVDIVSGDIVSVDMVSVRGFGSMASVGLDFFAQTLRVPPMESFSLCEDKHHALMPLEWPYITRQSCLNECISAGDNEEEEEEVQEVQRPMGRDRAKKKGAASMASSTSGNEDLLDRLMVNEFVDLTQTHKEKKSKNVEAFIEIKKREVELRAQDIRMREAAERRQEMTEHHQELQFYLQPHDHLSGLELEITLDLKRSIKEGWNLQN